MLRFLVHLMRTRFPQLPRYLETNLGTSCDLTTSHDHSASTPAGYKQPQPPPITSYCQPRGLGPQDQGHRTVPLAPPPSSHLPALKEAKPAMPPHLPTYLLESEMTKPATPLHLPLYANVGYKQP